MKVFWTSRHDLSPAQVSAIRALHGDDAEVVKLAGSSNAQKVTYALSESEGADVFASGIAVSRTGVNETGIAGMSFKVHAAGSVTPVLIRDTLGAHWTYPALVAAAVAGVLGVNMVEVAEGLSELKLEPGRMRVLSGIKDATIIDDTYNASPASVAAALKAAAGLVLPAASGESEGVHRGTAFAVLGDMLELGS